jgi:hypothetical protein
MAHTFFARSWLYFYFILCSEAFPLFLSFGLQTASAMSRPNDGQSLFPSFGNPFRMVSSNRLSDQFAKLNQILNAFETSLTRILKKLEPNILKDKINLSWVQQAMGFYLLYTRTSSPLLQISNSLQQNGMRNGWTNTWMTLWHLV